MTTDANACCLLAYDSAQGEPRALVDPDAADTVVTQSWYWPRADADADTQWLAYMNTLLASPADAPRSGAVPHPRNTSFGLNVTWVRANHPDWILLDKAGQPARTSDYKGMYVLDVGNAQAQQQWARSVYRALNNAPTTTQRRFDGVWVDDANLYPGHGLSGRLAKYTDEQYGDAMRDFLLVVGDFFRARHKAVWCNLAATPWVPRQLANALVVARRVSGISREHWCRYGDVDGPFGTLFNTSANSGTPPVAALLDYAVKLQGEGARIGGVDYGYSPATAADRAAMTYGRAMWLLAWDGTPGSFYAYRPSGPTDATADPSWMTYLGTPTEPGYRVLADGTYRRDYSAGHVLLTPTPGAESAQLIRA